MAQVYANLIKKGLKRIEDVPEQLRAEVEAILNDQKLVNYFVQKGSEYYGNDLCELDYQRSKNL